MTLFEDTNPHDLKVLLDQVHRGESALPDFQRDFVWDPNETQELIVSIANNYPAGGLLRIRNTHNLFAHREFQGAPALNGRRSTFLVLDGQQRLTSLYQAFHGVGEHRFYLRIQRLIDDADFEDAIFHLRATTKRSKRLECLETQAKELILPLSVLKGGAGGFGRWTRQVVRALPLHNHERVALEDKLADIEESWIRRIDDYRFPVVTLADSTEADAVCTIFETLNRTGVKLSVFELLTARFWPKNVNLRELWAGACGRYPSIQDFLIDPYYVLQVISLVSRSTPSCKRSDVLDLTATDIIKWWDRAVTGLDRTLQILKEDCGVMVPKWLPYYTILVPFAAALTVREKLSGPKSALLRECLVRWFWCSVFGQSYENSPNSQSAKDLTEIFGWLDGGSAPESVSEFRFDPYMLRDTTPRQRALYRGAICLILRNGSRDFHTAQPISGDLIVENHIDDHHIFPDSYLRKGNTSVTARLRDCVLNRTLIDRATNKRISDCAPSDYMSEIRATLKGPKFGELLSSHFVPEGDDSPIWSDNFDDFLNQRQAAFWDEIRKATGVTEASDLIEEEAA